MGKAASMCGPPETVVAMMTVTATDTPPACGPSLLTQPSMMDALRSTMKAAPPPSPPPSATAVNETLKQAW